MVEVWKGRILLPLLVYPAISGIVLGAAFPPLPLGFLACVGLIPLFLSAERLQGRAAFGAGFVQGLVFYGATIYWISWISPPGTAAAIFYMSVFRGLSIWALSLVVRRFEAFGLWSAPFLWVGFEYFNSLGDLGFPWVVLGNSQTAYLPLIQYAELTGVYGVSFWVVLVNLTVLALLRPRVRRSASVVVLVLLFAAPAVQGYMAFARADEGETIPVGVVQPDIPPVAKEYGGFWDNFEILKSLTVQAVEGGARLVVWPETAAAFYVNKEAYRPYQEGVQTLVDSLNVYLYTGAYRRVEDARIRTYNSSFLFAPGRGTVGYYDKTKLVPFGERSPFPELLPFLRDMQFTGGGYVGGNWDSGEVRTVFEGPGARFSGLICFDSAFPGLVREFVAGGARFLVVITNDGWFGKTSGPFQHAEIAVFRAIENRRAVVRCANTGVSTFIDAYGRKSRTTGIFHPEVLNGRVAVRSGLTFYTRYGDVFSQICTGLAVLVVVMAVRRKGGEVEEQTILPRSVAGSVPMGAEADPELPEEERSMPFLDHLEELRWRILKGLAAVVVGAIICAVFSNDILRALTWPVQQMEAGPTLIYLKPMGMFMVKLEIALWGGAVLALPVLLYQVWLFVAPGLFASERKYVAFIVFSSTVCFVVGSALAYWGVIPLALKFLLGLGAETGVEPQYDIGFYTDFVLKLLVAFGVVFELPVATFFLARVGVVTPERMRTGRRYAVVVGFVLAALLTPPDPVSQLMMALPLIVLYEISIWVAKVAGR